MVSLRRSHCHSASETFMGRPWSPTRSRTLRRTSSSARRSSLSTRRSLSVARRTTRDSTLVAALSSEQSLQRLHRLIAPSPSADTRPQSCPRSTSTITGSSRRSEAGSSVGQLKYPLRFPLNRTSTTKVNSFLGQRTHGKVLLLAAFEELVDLELAELPQVALERLAQRLGGRLGVGVRAAGRLGDDLIDHTQVEQVLRRDLQRLGGALPLRRILPENGGAPLRGNYRVHRVLEHQHPVGQSHRERPTGTPLADHHGDDGRPERGHLDQ